MNNTEFILSEIKKWKDEDIITEEQETLLSERYGAMKTKNPLRTVLTVLGGLFVAAGIVTVVATGWTGLPQTVQLVLSFLPLVIAQITAFIVLIKGKLTAPVREGVALFYTAALFGTYKLTEFVFNAPTDYSRYILVCGLMILPVIILFRSVLAPAAYLFAVISWADLAVFINGYSIHNLMIVIATVLLIAAGTVVTLLNGRNEGRLLKTVSLWVAIAGVITGCGFIAPMLGIKVAAVLLPAFCILFLIGTDDNIFSPFSTAGTAGTVVLLLITLSGATETKAEEKTVFQTVAVLILCVAVIVLWAIRGRKDAKKTVLSVATLIGSAVTLIAQGRFLLGENAPFFLSFPLMLGLLAVGVTYLTAGIRDSSLKDLNAGFLTIVFAGGFFFSGLEITTFIKGVLILILGIILLVMNILSAKRTKKKTEVTADEN